MNFESQKNILKLKYANNKTKYYIHLAALYIKNIYHRPVHTVHAYGQGNKIPHCPKGLKIYIYGNSNVVDIDSSISTFQGKISIGEATSPTHNCTVKIGANSSSAWVDISLREDNSSVTIGENCMFSWNINIWNTDFHTIYDETTKKCLNIGKDITIGDHVWIGNGAYILKNTQIASNSIIGAGAVVSKKFTEPHVIIAGVPAKIIKRGINWSTETVKNYLAQQSVSL